jgi:large subunit ribosomal protein L21
VRGLLGPRIIGTVQPVQAKLLKRAGRMLYSKALRIAAAHSRAVRGAGFFERSHMYAVIKTGGKQYKVAAGEKIKVEQIAADVGQEVVIEQVLAVGSGADLKVGSPWVAGATVSATVVAHGKHDKVRIFKMRRRKHYQKHGGHRQTYTELHIGSING